VLTISNYDTYQRVALPEQDNISRNDGTTAGQRRDKLESIETLKEEDAHSASSRPGARCAYTPEFETFWSAYPKTDTANPKAEAFKVFDRLAEDDRALALASLPGFTAWVRRQFKGYNAPGAAVYLRQRRFERHVEDGSPPAVDPAKVRAQLRTKAECHFRGDWRPGWGPSPGEAGCTIPDDVVAEAARATGRPWPVPPGFPDHTATVRT
jgi:hypothetical protein